MLALRIEEICKSFVVSVASHFNKDSVGLSQDGPHSTYVEDTAMIPLSYPFVKQVSSSAFQPRRSLLCYQDVSFGCLAVIQQRC